MQNNDQNTPGFYLEQEDNLNIQKYLFLVLTNWYWFVLSIIVALMAAYLVNRYSLPQYSASATIILQDQGTQSGVDDIFSDLRAFRIRRTKSLVENEIPILQSYELARRTIEKLDFAVEYTAHGRIKEIPMYKSASIRVLLDTSHAQLHNHPAFVYPVNEDKYRLEIDEGMNVDTILHYGDWFERPFARFQVHKRGSFSHVKYSFTVKPPEQLANLYRGKVQVAQKNEESSLLTLSMNGHVPDKLVSYLNQLCKEYIHYGLEQKNLTAENTMVFIDEQINIILDSLRNIEKQIFSYRRQHDIIDLSREGELAFEKLKRFNQDLTRIQFQQNYLNYLQKYVQERKDPQNLIMPSLAGMEESMVASLLQELKNLYLERNALKQTAQSGIPGLQQINEQILLIRDQLLEVIGQAKQSNNETLAQLNQEIQIVETQIQQLPNFERGLLNIQRKYDLNNKFYTFLLEKRAEAGIKKASNVPDNRILDEARLDNVKKTAPDEARNRLMAILLGFILPMGIIFLRDYFNTKIIERKEIEQATRVPIIGNTGHNDKDSELPVFENPRSGIAESFRTIRTNLQYLFLDKDQKVITITSTVSGEGKTFCAINLATILAISNKKTLLVSLDLRKPTIHRVFNLNNKAGISTYVIGKDPVDSLPQETAVENLTLVTSGPIPPNPAELLETDQMKAFFEWARAHFDYIVLDTPPLAIVSDALILNRYTDINVFVIRQDYSDKQVLKLVDEMYTHRKMKQLCILVNDVKAPGYYGYHYSYGYGYGYGYGGYGYGYGARYGYGYGQGYYGDDDKRKPRFRLRPFRRRRG